MWKESLFQLIVAYSKNNLSRAVGAGSAGSTLAARLSEVPCVSVLLLEAGTGNIPLLNEIPAIAKNFWFTNLDWQFKTVPQRHTGEALVNRVSSSFFSKKSQVMSHRSPVT
ncbi:hypothetical protein AVEN_10858-1 [Araneus ventricosus]|uniref:Uncharacterized protein n=1 Tax=Araneus ventricosus TaxID=182803 RepID=A0A4Y2V043_ARAVE|nr:hypothetical protein AVEN_10858-1 [Araneus ventricosus]